MKKCFLFILISGSVFAREFRTPITLSKHPMHNILCTDDEHNWTWHTWTGGYFRKASQALIKEADGNPLKSKSVPLSHIFFGAAKFAAQDAFANRTATDPLNPFLSTTIAPQLTYVDRGFVIGAHATKNYSDEWRFGARVRLPYRRFTIENNSSRSGHSGKLGGQGAQDLLVFKDETINGSQIKSFAFRLDVLNKLRADCKQPGLSVPFINFSNSMFPGNPVTMSNQNVNVSATVLPPEDRHPVTLIGRSDGTLPPEPFAIPTTTANALPCLSNNGSSITNNERERFCPAPFNYTQFGNNSALFPTIWVVPSVDTGNSLLSQPAAIIREHVQQLLTCFTNNAEQVFEDCGMNLCSQTRSGVGDMDVELFAQWLFTQHTYLEFMLGTQYAIGQKMHSSNNLFKQPLGNNGHTEIKTGLHWYFAPSPSFILSTDFAYSWVLQEQEQVAASFVGAIVKNLGPSTLANIKWNYYVTHFEMRIKPPIDDYHTLEYVLGHELYHKGRDHIEFCQKETTDCLGNTSKLDPCALESNTRIHAHKIYTELSYRYNKPGGGGFGIFGGFSRVVRGDNAPKEQEWYLDVHLRT